MMASLRGERFPLYCVYCKEETEQKTEPYTVGEPVANCQRCNRLNFVNDRVITDEEAQNNWNLHRLRRYQEEKATYYRIRAEVRRLMHLPEEI